MKFSALFTAAGLMLGLSAYAQSNDCDQIRAVKRLANQQGLDDSTLQALEAQYCSTGSSQDCADISVVSRLASVSSNDSSFLKQITTKWNQVCNNGKPLDSWKNGTYIRDNSGSLFYPNGAYAKSSKKWLYVNGNIARSASDEWYYPNGNSARDNKKNWYDPNGNSLSLEDLLTKGCNKVSESFCNSSLQEIKLAANDEKAAAIIQFTWVAWSKTPDSNANTSQDCSDLTMMYRLAVLDNADSSLLKLVSSRQKTVCSGGSNSSDWSNGKTAKYSSGSWNYPNGTSAKYTSGAWNYPSGTSAKFSGGAWNYPNGKSAKYSSGKWADPDGDWVTVDELLTRSCEKVPEPDCAKSINYIKSTTGEEKTFAIIEFVAFAWSWQSSNPAPSNNNTYSNGGQDCLALDFMGRLALLGGGNNDVQSAIEKKRKSVCATNTDSNTISWTSGLTAKNSSGAWYYPNGLTAKNTSSTWYYPNGLTAKNSSTWYYPNGLTAKNSSGTWYDPSGVSTTAESLLTKACEKLPENLCNQGINSIQSMNGDSQIFGIIEFSYTAWNYKKGY